MSDTISELVDSYFSWLKDKTVLKTLENKYVEVTTPYLDSHNDRLQIYVKIEDDEVTLTDDGYILNDLEMSGCDFSRKRRKALLNQTLNGLGVSLNSKTKELFVTASKSNFPQKKHRLLQAMMSVNDMFYISSGTIGYTFYDEAKRWLESSNVRYSSNIKLEGKSGYPHNFDFLIPHYKKEPERIIQTVNNPSKDNIENVLFKWVDTKDVRESNGYLSALYVLLNDTSKEVRRENITAFESYDIHAYPWSKREELRPVFSA